MDASAKYCARLVRASGSNFRIAFGCLTTMQRRAMTATYAYCRVVDDVVDSAFETDAKRKQLGFWRGQLPLCAKGISQHPLMQELHWAISTFGIPLQYFAELLEGVAQDIEPTPPQTLADLLRYCYGVAGTVGLICLRIFGVEETTATREAAITLGHAFQLTNILRDLVSDVRLGRFYLPQEDLVRFGVTVEALRAGIPTPELARFIAFEAERAEGFFRAAWGGFPPALHRQLLPAQLMSACYFALLSQIRREPLRVLRERVRLAWWQKLRLLVGHRYHCCSRRRLLCLAP